jgi:uncharacterized protein involved in response to NO
LLGGMTSSAEQMRKYRGPAVFSFGFRPFFLGGALFAALGPLAMAASFIAPFTIGGAAAMTWHAHEMVYGYLAAVVAGFLLTAVPNWTGRLPALGGRLVFLFGLWLAGRAAMMFAASAGNLATAIVDCAFLVFLAAFIWREVLIGKNWRNAPVCVIVSLFAVGNIIWHVEASMGVAHAVGFRFGIGLIGVLLALIGGRVTPSFTRNWLAQRGRAQQGSASIDLIDKIALGLIGAGMIGWVLAPYAKLTGLLLLAASAMHFYRLSRWGGWRTLEEPLVVILHLGYFWLVVSVALLGVSALWPTIIPSVSALHALTAGAAGVMTLAVMTRATLGHTGRALTADRVTTAIYVLVNLGAAMRVAAASFPGNYAHAALAAAIVWSSAFLLFSVVYGRYLLSPRIVKAT